MVIFGFYMRLSTTIAKQRTIYHGLQVFGCCNFGWGAGKKCEQNCPKNADYADAR